MALGRGLAAGIRAAPAGGLLARPDPASASEAVASLLRGGCWVFTAAADATANHVLLRTRLHGISRGNYKAKIDGENSHRQNTRSPRKHFYTVI